jgi:hypothetical protein
VEGANALAKQAVSQNGLHRPSDCSAKWMRPGIVPERDFWEVSEIPLVR